MAFSTEAEIILNLEIARLTSEASWTTPQFDERIKEGDAEIEGCLADMGYDLPALLALSPVPKLLNELSKLYARAAILRDLFVGGPVSSSEDRHEEMFKTYQKKIDKLKDRQLQIVDDAGETITFVDSTQEVLVNTLDVRRALGMEDPEFQVLDTKEYADPDMRGDPDC